MKANMKLVLAFVSLCMLVALSSGDEDIDPGDLEEIRGDAGGGHARIIGGTLVTDNRRWPWQGALVWKYTFSRRVYYKCGCVVLPDGLHAITAAHCVRPSRLSSLKQYQVWFGSAVLTRGMTKVNVVKITSHSGYFHGRKNGINFPNDLAVLKFSRRVPQTGNTLGLTDASSPDPDTNPDCYITGWGKTSASGGISIKLQEARIDVYSHANCKRTQWGRYINGNHICVGENSSKGSCNGDSGGPLVCKVGGAWKLYGITSWGHKNCSTIYPSVYTSCGSYGPWINNNLN